MYRLHSAVLYRTRPLFLEKLRWRVLIRQWDANITLYAYRNFTIDRPNSLIFRSELLLAAFPPINLAHFASMDRKFRKKRRRGVFWWDFYFYFGTLGYTRCISSRLSVDVQMLDCDFIRNFDISLVEPDTPIRGCFCQYVVSAMPHVHKRNGA